MCSLASDLTGIEILNHVLGLGQRSGDYCLEYAGYTGKSTRTRLGPRSERCRCDHETVWESRTPPKPLAACSLAELAMTAGFNGGLQRVCFRVDDMAFVQSGICGCGRRHPLDRFLAPGGRGPQACDVCRQPLRADAFFSHRPVAASDLGETLHQPLAQIGVECPRCVLVIEDSRAVLFREAATDASPYGPRPRSRP